MGGDDKACTIQLKRPPADLSKPQPPTSPKRVFESKKNRKMHEGQTLRAGVWAGLYFVVWLVQRLWCHLDLPKHCNLSEEPLDVLTDLLVLFVFSLAQAWWCKILEHDRFEQLKTAWWLPLTIFLTPIIISALGLIKGLEPWDKTNPGEDFEFSSVRSTVFIFGLVAVVLFIAWHFAHAWLNLPGVKLISGGGQDKKDPPPNLYGVYFGSRVVIVVYTILFTSFLLVEDNGMNYRGPLIAWALSLLAAFPRSVSVFWLAVTTGIFLQGIGSNRLQFLGCN